MRIALISTCDDVTSISVRLLASYLKSQGQQVALLFLLARTRPEEAVGFEEVLPDSVLNEVVDVCSECDIIGLSLMTNFFNRAVQVTRHLKKRLSKPIIWGGIHPTTEPLECLKYADIVCLGEGEQALTELMQKMESGQKLEDTPNLWFNTADGIVKNPTRYLITNLDAAPFPDYLCAEDYAADAEAGHLVKLDEKTLDRFVRNTPYNPGVFKYQTITSRGCPHRCSYCCNNALSALYQGRKLCRYRTVDNVIQELSEVKERFPLQYVLFSDDAFFSRGIKWIEEFSKKYRESIALPFYCLATPQSVQEEKVSFLADAGLAELQIGVQSGSRSTLELYRRAWMKEEHVLEAGRVMSGHRNVNTSYDFIIDNPFETHVHRIETLRLIARIPRPFRLNLFSLTFFPGTELHEKVTRELPAFADVSQTYKKNYRQMQPSYITLLFVFAQYAAGLPLKILTSRLFVFFFNRRRLNFLYRFMYSLARFLRRTAKRLKPKSAPA